MKGLRYLAITVVVPLSIVLAGCASAAPAPAPTAAPASPIKAVEAPKPTAVPPTAAPTAAPKVEFPQKGKAINFVVPFAAGAGSDMSTRLVTSFLEKELGTPVQVTNKAGAGSQTGLMEFVQAKADGYTVGMTNLPTTIMMYLDLDRKAIFGRKDFAPLACPVLDPGIIAVKADSPYKTMNDFIDAAKANPEKVKVSTNGVLGAPHLAVLKMQEVTGAKFAVVHFDGSAPAMTALMGGHIDAVFGFIGDMVGQIKGGEIRTLGVADSLESPYLPGVKTMEAQGYKMQFATARGYSVAAGTPKEVVDILGKAFKSVSANPELKKKQDEIGMTQRYMDAAAYASYWDQMEKELRPLMDEAKKAKN